MAERLTIGIFAQGGADWVGGAELTKNLVIAALRAADDDGLDLRIVLLGRNREHSSLTADWLKDSRIVEAEWPPSRRPRENFPKKRKIQPVGWRRWLGKSLESEEFQPSEPPNQEVGAQALEELGIDFIYPARRWPAAYRDRSAAWIFDLQHRVLPDMFPPEDWERREANFQRLASQAGTIVFSSEAAREQFAEFYPECRANTPILPFRVSVPDAWKRGDAREAADRYGLPENFYLVCNQLWKHKNHKAVIEAIAQRVASGEDCTAVFTGRVMDRRDLGFTDEILAQIHLSGVHHNIRILGLIPKADQVQLIRSAKAVIQPSFFEGWNTLVEECHALGTPILLSDLPVHREQSPPCARYFDPSDASSLVEQMRAFETESSPCHSEAGEDYDHLFVEFGRRFLAIAKQGSRV